MDAVEPSPVLTLPEPLRKLPGAPVPHAPLPLHVSPLPDPELRLPVARASAQRVAGHSVDAPPRGGRGRMSAPAPAPREDMSALIVAIAQRADREAFARLFRHFAPRIKGFLVRNGLPANAAEELAQETLLAVWRKAGYFDPARAAASTWIFTIARNLSIDLKRRERYGDTFRAEAQEDEVDETSGETILMTAERDARVQAALAKLSEEQATILRLSFFQEKPHSQIAQELGIPLGTAKSRVRLALSRLRSLLEDVR